MWVSPQLTPNPSPYVSSKKLRKATTAPSRLTAAAALALLLAAAPAAAAPARTESLAETLHATFAGLWERVAAAPGVLLGVWEEIGAAIDPHGEPIPDPPPTFGAAIDPHG